MTEPFKTSCKQINMFGPKERPSIGGCPRSWGYRYLDHIKSPIKPPYLVEGVIHHHCTRALVETGRMPENVPLLGVELEPGVLLLPEHCEPEGHYGRMARASLRYLPDRPGGTWFAEASDLIPWKTAKGVECLIHLKPDVISDPVGPWWLIDWKKTSSKSKALRSLEEDVQANVYAYGLMREFQKNAIFARWIYVLNKTYEAWPVDTWFQFCDTEDWLHENIDATIELMYTFKAAGIHALDLPGDLACCKGTGLFCDYRDDCLQSPVGELPSRLISLTDIVRYKEGTLS